jgi:rhodanese-related sulfurtransferase
MTMPDLSLTGQSTMQEILEAYPGAQRALFRKHHIGGCSHCGFQPAETLEQVCQRNNNLNVADILDSIRASHEQDEKVFMSAKDLAQLRRENPALTLLDVRSRQEFDAVHIAGSVLMSQTVTQEIMSQWPRDRLLIIIDHQGRSGLDAAAYFAGHGFANVRCLRGGLDAWSQDVDPKLPRYRLA